MGVIARLDLDDLLIVRVAGAEHHPVLAKANGTLVAVGRHVPDGQRRHKFSTPKLMHDSRAIHTLSKATPLVLVSRHGS